MTEDSAELADSGEKWQGIALLVASGKTIKEASEELSIPERTAYRYSSLPAFRQTVGQLRSAALDASVGEITTATSLAVRKLVELLEDPQHCLQAAKALLTNATPLSDLGELRQRITELEAKS